MRLNRTGRRAYVTMSVLMLLGFIAVVLLSMTVVFAAQARRTAAGRDEPQLRQLLQAGAWAAKQYQVEAAGPGSVPPRVPAAVALPAELAARHARLTVQFLDETHARITATLDTRRMTQTVTLGTGGQVEAAELGGVSAMRPAGR